MQRVKYNYGYKFNEQRMKKHIVMLPMTDKGNPDYEYMEAFKDTYRRNEAKEIMNKDDDTIMKSIPFGIEDFKELRENDGYFVDKTVLIEDIMTDKTTKVFLFTRPRRFGKSLNMSMLDAFFNLDYAGKSQKWFEGLRIYDNKELMAMANQDPVIYMSMKDMDKNDFDRFIDDFVSKIQELCHRYEYLRKWDVDSNLKNKFVSLYNGKAGIADLKRSLRDISTALTEYHGKKTIILIDEYDNPINGSFNKEVQSEIIGFMRDLLSNALKTNESLKFGVVTGVMQIAKSIFSGLNNLYVNNIFSKDFDECFGFTEDETKEMLSYYGHPEKFDECKEWYDGYTFGNAEVYNPWSIINYVKERFEPATYWGGTSGNDIVKTLLQTADDDVWDDLEELSKGGTINRYLDPYVVYQNIEGRSESVYAVMAMSGYLKATRTTDGYDLSIPNKEIFEVYSQMTFDTMDSGKIANRIRNLFREMQKGDVEAIGNKIHDLMKDTISSKVLDSEHTYQAYLIGMMMGFCGNYEIYGDTLESGDGFADIIFRKRKGPGCNLILELKKSDDEKDLQKDAERAMQQILDRDYAHGFEGRTLLYGISFHSKKPYIISRILD